MCVVSRGQARKQSVAQECKGPGDDDTEMDGSDSSSLPCESTGLVRQHTLAPVLHLGGSQFQFHSCNWVDKWSLDELKKFQCQDEDMPSYKRQS